MKVGSLLSRPKKLRRQLIEGGADEVNKCPATGNTGDRSPRLLSSRAGRGLPDWRNATGFGAEIAGATKHHAQPACTAAFSSPSWR